MNTVEQSQQQSGHVKSEREGPVVILTLCYPARRNALSLSLRADLVRRLQAAVEDVSCRVIVLAGADGVFCSGGDISSFAGVTSVNGRERMVQAQEITRLIVAGAKPLIAAVEGCAIGAGMSIMASCDMVISANDAFFACNFNRIGLLPDLGAIWALPNRMGAGRARMLMMSARRLTARQAAEQGLVDELCEPGAALSTARTLAHEVAETAPLSNALLKSVLARGLTALGDALAAEADIQGLLYSTEDFQEGRSAFLEKRKAVFSGK